MSVTAVGDRLLKSHKKPKKSESADLESPAKNVDEVGTKQKKRREATKDVLPLNHRDEAPAISASSPPSAGLGTITSNNTQLADRSDESRKQRKRKDQTCPEDVMYDQSKDANKLDESRKEKKEKKKKKKHSDEGNEEGAAKSHDTRVQTVEEVTSDKSQHKKKRKRSAEEHSEDTPSANTPHKKKKSSRQTDISFPDPSADESLSDQSQKALSYAYSRFQDLPNWKFNKARQIWLIKKLWSEEMIPEKYFALVAKYLAGAEGKSRDTLVQMCNSEIASVTADASVESADLSNGGSTTMAKVTRARSLLDVLSRVQED